MTVRIHSLLAQLGYLLDRLSNCEELYSAEAPPCRDSGRGRLRQDSRNSFESPFSARSQANSDIPLDTLSMEYLDVLDYVVSTVAGKLALWPISSCAVQAKSWALNLPHATTQGVSRAAAR